MLGEKGSTFLFYLEQKLGGAGKYYFRKRAHLMRFTVNVQILFINNHLDVFDPFLRAYVEQFKFKSITTDDFLTFFKQFFHLYSDILDSIDFDHWICDPGLPRMRPVFVN